MNRYGKRCVLYPRVSTEMQVDGYSLEGQKNMLTRFADREEMIVVDTYEDAGKSGKSIEGRPAFQKMLRDIEDGLDIDYILVYKLSRFGRNAADILNSLELVQSYGVNLICIEEGIDSSQTSGKLLISVLSAVAEIERENIIEQTMNGRREKARQGGWNGGFAPYGYTLEDNKLMIEETEAVAIRKIFELYTSSEIGLGGIANQLNLQGIRKIPRQNGTLEDWTGHFIKLILDNPVYCGKIAYGRRTKEKVKGTKNDYQMKRNDDYILTEGQHKGIVSEEVWEKAHAKRLRTGVKQPSKIGRDRVHLLSGLLKCPVCGSPMYTNKHAWTNKDGTYKEIYYYVCSRNRMVRGKHCEYKAMLKKTDIEPMVIEAIREIVRNEEYAQAIKKRIGVQIDTKSVDKELEGYQAKLKEVDLNKTRLEREIDSLPADAKYRERKLHDMTLRLDSLYDVIVELEEKIEDARLRRDAIKQQAITLENIYKIMVNFDCVYNIINDEEKRNVVTALIKEIEIYRNDESEYPLKRIGLNFPVFKDGGEVTELLWDKGNTVDTVFSLEEPLEIKEDGMIWRCPGITDDTVNVVMLLMAAKYVHETEPELPCGLIFAADLGEEGLGNLCGVRALVDHYEKNLCGMAAFDLYRDKMYPICIGSVRYRISAKTKGGHSFLNFGRKNAIAELAGLIGELYRFQTDAASHTTYNVGKIEGGTSVNTIAQDASMLFEFRSEDYRSLEACETYLEETIAARQSEEVQYSCELVGKRPCARETDPVQMARMTRCAQKTLKAADGEEPVCSEASTDCNIPLSRHIPAICVGFCRGGGAHTREEWLDAASVEDGMCAAVALVCRLPWMCCESRVVVRDGIEDRKEKEEIRQLLEMCDQDFVPPLSHRNSTSQTNWAETEEKTDGIAEYLENICSQHVVLWKEEGVVRAFMTWKDHFNCENLEAYPDSCYLTTLCVWPDYRGQGISEVMYAEAEKDIAAKFPGSRITLRTWSTNGAQEHILDKLGYSLVRRLKDDRGEGIDTVYFVKKEENEKNDR